jgi:PHD/YefM family antitoxin component YafN of YafNO toxin-antitoxin module
MANTTSTITRTKIGRLPVVVLPLTDYETLLEDLEMLRSKNLPQTIKKAREDIKKGRIYTLDEVKKILNLS